MNTVNHLNNISFSLSSIAHCRLGPEWFYENVISPFSRLYLITDGEAYVQIDKKLVNLKSGYMYLIPSFASCNYTCPDYMEQYYATLSIHVPNHLNIYQLYNFKHEVKAEAIHYEYFKNLCELNKGMELPTGDPKIYQKRMKLGINNTSGANANATLKSTGILNLFLSEFIESPKMNLESEVHQRISDSIKGIHKNLHKNITVAHLAELSCLSPDHYTRKFKELTGQTPLDYINKQRIEKALLLLSTTPDSINEIAFKCGFVNHTHFGKVFRKYISQTPSAYRKNPI